MFHCCGVLVYVQRKNTCEADPTNDTSGRILCLELVAERNANRKLHLIACADVPSQVVEVGLMTGRLKLNPEGVFAHVGQAPRLKNVGS